MSKFDFVYGETTDLLTRAGLCAVAMRGTTELVASNQWSEWWILPVALFVCHQAFIMGAMSEVQGQRRSLEKAHSRRRERTAFGDGVDTLAAFLVDDVPVPLSTYGLIRTPIPEGSEEQVSAAHDYVDTLYPWTTKEKR